MHCEEKAFLRETLEKALRLLGEAKPYAPVRTKIEIEDLDKHISSVLRHEFSDECAYSLNGGAS